MSNKVKEVQNVRETTEQSERTLPQAVRAELDYLGVPFIDVKPEGKNLFQLYRHGRPTKDGMSEEEVMIWLDGFREGRLSHLSQAEMEAAKKEQDEATKQ